MYKIVWIERLQTCEGLQHQTLIFYSGQLEHSFKKINSSEKNRLNLTTKYKFKRSKNKTVIPYYCHKVIIAKISFAKNNQSIELY